MVNLVGAPCHLKSDSRSDQDPTKVTPAVAFFCGRSSVVNLGQAPSGAGEGRRSSLERTDHYRWTLLHTCSRSVCGVISIAHRSVLRCCETLELCKNHPKNDRMANVPVKPTMCAFISSLMLRILCVPRARQDACSSLSKKPSPAKRRPPAGMALPLHQGSTPRSPSFHLHQEPSLLRRACRATACGSYGWLLPTPFDQTGSSLALSCSGSQESDRAFACSLSAAAVFQLRQHFCGCGSVVNPCLWSWRRWSPPWKVLMTAILSSCKVSLKIEAAKPSVSGRCSLVTAWFCACVSGDDHPIEEVRHDAGRACPGASFRAI